MEIISLEIGLEQYYIAIVIRPVGKIVHQQVEAHARAETKHRRQTECRGIFALKEDLFGFNFRYLTSAPNVYLYENVTYPTLDLFFTCTIDNPRDIVASSDEVGSFKFFEPARIPLDKIAFESSRKALEFYINLMRQKRKRS